jgi:hypothetical protein
LGSPGYLRGGGHLPPALDGIVDSGRDRSVANGFIICLW